LGAWGKPATEASEGRPEHLPLERVSGWLSGRRALTLALSQGERGWQAPAQRLCKLL